MYSRRGDWCVKAGEGQKLWPLNSSDVLNLRAAFLKVFLQISKGKRITAVNCF